MKTRRDEIAEDVFHFLDRKLSPETKSKLSSSEIKEVVYALSDFILIENFNSIFDHLQKFQTAIMTIEEPSESDFLDQLKNL